MSTAKTYSEDQIMLALTNLSKSVTVKAADASIFTSLQRGLAPDSPIMPLLKEALNAAASPEAQQEFDELYKELAPGDTAVFLQATHLEELNHLKMLLSDFRVSNYRLTERYVRARDIEPSFFFPRLFYVKVRSISPSLPGHNRSYLCDIITKDGSLANPGVPPILCPEENMFVSSADIEKVEAIYRENVDKSIAWLDEMTSAKTEELNYIVRNLVSSITEDFAASLEALDATKNIEKE